MKDKESVAQLRDFWVSYGRYLQKRGSQWDKQAPTPRMSEAEALKLLKAKQASSKQTKAPRP